MSEVRDADSYQVQSPWGAVAAFFLLQCFGTVALHGFRMFANIAIHGDDKLNPIFAAQGGADRLFLTFWGLAWIVIFVLFQSFVLHRIRQYLKCQGVGAVIKALKHPGEALRLLLAIAFGITYATFLMGHYPFPHAPISVGISTMFSVFGWGASAMLVWMRDSLNITVTCDARPKGTPSTIIAYVIGFLIGAIFFAAALFAEPGLFYFHGMLGLFVMTMMLCQFLFLSRQKEVETQKEPAGQLRK